MNELISNYSQHLSHPTWSHFLNHHLIEKNIIDDLITNAIFHYNSTNNHLDISQLRYICDYLQNTSKCISLASIMARSDATYDWILYEFKHPNYNVKNIGINYKDLADHFKNWSNIQKIDFLTQLPHMKNLLLEINTLDATIEILE